MSTIVLSLWLREGAHRRWAHREVDWPSVPCAGDRVRLDPDGAEAAVQSVTWDAASGAATVDLGALEIGAGEGRDEAAKRLADAGWTLAAADHEHPPVETEPAPSA